MRLILSILLSFIVLAAFGQGKSTPKIDLTVFTKVPDELDGCGNAYYLSEKDRKNQVNLICCTNFDEVMICINRKPLLLKKMPHFNGYSSGYYLLTIDDGKTKQMDTEYYIMKSVITLKYNSKIIWTKPVFGDGGC